MPAAVAHTAMPTPTAMPAIALGLILLETAIALAFTLLETDGMEFGGVIVEPAELEEVDDLNLGAKP